MELDLGTQLEWVAALHYNTGHPHVHIALRGIDQQGKALRLDRAYIQHGVRHRAEDLATQQLGYRTVLDAEEAQRREVREQRYTSLDRILNRENRSPANETAQPAAFMVDLSMTASSAMSMRVSNLQGRLLFLQRMGLAQHESGRRWTIRSDFKEILRAMQCATDRQRSLASHQALLSDPRLPLQVTDARQTERLEGRVLGHGEEETTTRTYMMLEGTDRKIHFIYHTADIQNARHQGRLAPNAFITLMKLPSHSARILDFGDADRIVSNRVFMLSTARRIIARGIVPVEGGYAGWLGRYEAALSGAVSVEQARSFKYNEPKDRSR
jgi:Protein of unknown function (DUF3363)